MSFLPALSLLTAAFTSSGKLRFLRLFPGVHATRGSAQQIPEIPGSVIFPKGSLGRSGSLRDKGSVQQDVGEEPPLLASGHRLTQALFGIRQWLPGLMGHRHHSEFTVRGQGRAQPAWTPARSGTGKEPLASGAANVSEAATHGVHSPEFQLLCHSLSDSVLCSYPGKARSRELELWAPGTGTDPEPGLGAWFLGNEPQLLM